MSSHLVCAVVVTFNRLEMLRDSLNALLRQTYSPLRIVVVDNASTDETADYLRHLAAHEQSLDVVSLESNRGGAGGFAEGMKAALRLDAEFLWLLDDDTVVGEDALPKLVTTLESDENVAFACSLVTWADGGICEMNVPDASWDWTRRLLRAPGEFVVDSCSFVSVLIRGDVVQRVGLPLSEYFIWHDDVEYTLRLRKEGLGVLVSDSRVEHRIPRNRGVNFGDVNANNVWKFSYGVRNTIWTAKLHRDPGIALDLLLRIAQQTRRSSVPLRLRLQLATKALTGLLSPPPRDRYRSRFASVSRQELVVDD